MSAPPPAVRSFVIKFGGVIPEISCDIDPSGRTDLLKLIDAAEVAGHVSIVRSPADFKEDATLEVGPAAAVVKSLSDQETLLVVPLHVLMSVGLVVEEGVNYLPLRVGEVDESGDIFDLALVYTQTKEIAEDICDHLDACFQHLFHEAMNSPDFAGGHRDDFSAIQSVSSSCVSPLDQDPAVNASFPNVTEVRSHKNCPSTFSLSTSVTSGSSKNSLDLINEYITMLSACLSQEELHKFAILLKRWRSNEMPVLEFAQKLLELYGQERKHLLARMRSLLRDVNREDLSALSSFLQANGVSENASVSPLLTGELSLTTASGDSPRDNISACSATWSGRR
ncbi:hypothetical protein M3Y99_00787800 [Aphelenchoides fujianensis]|nr:hypothetical protein M3Y99_00787800 [Aphelenchoides fujianensis]